MRKLHKGDFIMLNIIVCLAVVAVAAIVVCGVEIAISDKYCECEKIGSMF